VVTSDWSRADFLVGDNVHSELASQALQHGRLLFSSNFLVQCVAQERLVNAGPFILHFPRDDVAAAQQQQQQEQHSGNANNANIGNDEAEDGEMGDLIAELELMSSSESVASPPPSAKKKRSRPAKQQKSPTNSGAAPSSAAKKRGVERRLDAMDERRVEAVLQQFEDFMPNVNGASVSTVQFRGK
jgi:hypothetical protein